MDSALNVTITGTGNVAWHLVQALKNKVNILQICSRDIEHARELAAECNAEAIDSPVLITERAQFHIVAAKDDALAGLAAEGPRSGIWLHTSGSVPATVWKEHKEKYGVLYPLQTLTRNVPVEYSELPVFTEGSDVDTLAAIDRLAALITPCHHHADSELRKRLHIAAIFACNFACYLWLQADELLHRDGLDLSVLHPLLKETLNKVIKTSPEKAMTGPARRHDINTITQHTAMLDVSRRDLYQELSQLIMDHYE